VAYRSTTFANGSCSDLQSPSYQNTQSLFFLEQLNIYAIPFFRDRHIANLAVRGKALSKFPQWKENLIFTLVYCSYGFISVMWIWIQINLDPDLFWLEPDPWKSCGSLGCDFHPLYQNGIRVVAKSAGSENLILYLWPKLSAVALKQLFFKQKKGFANLSLGLF
jgi:hypothetical protein